MKKIYLKHIFCIVFAFASCFSLYAHDANSSESINQTIPEANKDLTQKEKEASLKIAQEETRFLSIDPNTINQVKSEANKTQEDPGQKPQEEGNPFCLKIAEQNLTTLPKNPDPSIGDMVDDPYAFYNFLTETIANPQEHDLRKRAFKIIANAELEEKIPWTTKAVIDQNTWQDMNLLNGSQKKAYEYLGSILCKNRTHTELGRAYLYAMLARPTDNINLLEARQAIIKELLQNKELFDALDKLLKEMALHEKLFTGLWDTELLMQFIKQAYFQLAGVGDYLNESSTALELRSLYGLSQDLIGKLIMTASIVFFTYYGLTVLSHYFNPPQVVSNFTSNFLGSSGPLFAVASWLDNKYVKAVAAIFAGTLSALSIKKEFQYLHVSFLYDDFLRKRLIHIGLYNESINSIFQAISQNQQINTNLSYFKNMSQFVNETPKTDKEFEKFIELLKEDTFDKDSLEGTRYIFSRGDMFCAYRLLGKVKKQFETTMAGIGEIDAYLTIAKIIKESESNANAKFCFPTYLNKGMPSIDLQGFWSPFIDPQVVVPNSMKLGAEFNVPNIIVTGPNSGGKSTILKGIILSTILAQSIGIAPAQTMAFTPFSYISTYINVPDSQVDQESHFQEEARRIFEYGDKVDELSKKNLFCLGMLDEVLAGTSQEEGATLNKRVLRALASYPNCININATHLKSVTELEQDTNGKYINYQVMVEENSDGTPIVENGKIKRLYTINPGISHQHIAVHVFKEKGVNSPFFNNNIKS